jgi:hypothetical protein
LRLTHCLTFAFAGVLAACSASIAETPAEVARDWGLLGLWRTDCRGKPSRSDYDLRFVVRNSNLYHDRDWGDGHDSSAVASATVTANGAIDLVVRFQSFSQTREWVLMKNDDRIRTVMNRNVDTNEYSVRDGKYISSGDTTPQVTHCARS